MEIISTVGILFIGWLLGVLFCALLSVLVMRLDHSKPKEKTCKNCVHWSLCRELEREGEALRALGDRPDLKFHIFCYILI